MELKEVGKVDTVGVGAKDVSVIDFISNYVALDWAMFASSVALYSHKQSAIGLLKKMEDKGVKLLTP